MIRTMAWVLIGLAAVIIIGQLMFEGFGVRP